MVYRIALIVLVIGKAQFRRAMLSCDSSCCVKVYETLHAFSLVVSEHRHFFTLYIALAHVSVFNSVSNNSRCFFQGIAALWRDARLPVIYFVFTMKYTSIELYLSDALGIQFTILPRNPEEIKLVCRNFEQAAFTNPSKTKLTAQIHKT